MNYIRQPYSFRAPNDTPRTAKGHLLQQPTNYKLAASFASPFSSSSSDGCPIVKSGSFYKKQWWVQNTGTTPWPPKCRIMVTFVPRSEEHTTYLRVKETFILDNLEVPQGGTYVIRFCLPTPSAKGIYHRRWKMIDPKGNPFGPTLYTDFQVI